MFDHIRAADVLASELGYPLKTSATPLSELNPDEGWVICSSKYTEVMVQSPNDWGLSVGTDDDGPAMVALHGDELPSPTEIQALVRADVALEGLIQRGLSEHMLETLDDAPVESAHVSQLLGLMHTQYVHFTLASDERVDG
jgi:hypothetical protein